MRGTESDSEREGCMEEGGLRRDECGARVEEPAHRVGREVRPAAAVVRQDSPGLRLEGAQSEVIRAV